MLDRAILAAELNVAASQTGAAYAEVCLQNGVDQLFFPGQPGPVGPAELHERAVKLYARDCRLAPSVRGHPPKSGPRGKLRRTSGGIHDTARYTLEFAEVLAWCAGVRARPPIGHMPTQPAVSAAIWILWSGGVGDNEIQPVRAPALKRARRACAAWGWRLRVEWLHVHRDVIHPDLARQAKHVVARRAEFARKLAPLRLVPIEHDDFELSTGGPLSHNFFVDIALETEPLFRPRYNAFALASANTGASWTLESLWTEAVGSPPGGDVAKWPQT